MLNWSNLHTFDSSQRKAFEQFCYTVAKRKYGHRGTFTPVDDSGGGSGVEFYLTLENGDVWGWQAKFFPDGRLNGSRKEQIKKSLKRSCEDHPTLRRWFLCTPMDFTPGEQQWFDETLPTSISEGSPVVPVGHILGLNHWGDTCFNDFLTEEWATGIHSYYFGELELSHSWFGNVYQKAERSPAGRRYTADLHSKSDVSEEAHRVLLSDEYLSHLESSLEEIETSYDAFRRAIRNMKQGRTAHSKWEGSRDAYLDATRAGDALDLVESAISQIREAVACLDHGELDWANVLNGADARVEELHSYKDAFERSIGLTRRDRRETEEANNDETSGQDRDLRDVTSDEHDINVKARNVLYPSASLLESLLRAQKNILHVLGDAGTGKTHLAFDLCHSRIESGLPSILLLGTSIKSREPLRRQLLNALDIPPTYSWKDFLNALDVAAERTSGRLPIIIDGLNESVVDGRLSKVWKNELGGLAGEIGQYDNLALITTCRTAYVKGIWPNGEPEREVKTYGFGRETGEAVDRYFNHYKIDANLTSASLGQFGHPIYLQIFCEATNPSREEVEHVHLGEHRLFEVFEDYVDKCNQRIADRLGLRQGKDILRPALNRVARVLWEEKKRHIPFERAIECIDQIPEEELESWEQSRTRAVESEGLLLSRTWSRTDEGEEEFEFAYDLMAGYFIAAYLVNTDQDLEVRLKDGAVLTALYGELSDVHPLYEDVRRCLAALIPEVHGKYLHDIMQASDANKYSMLECIQEREWATLWDKGKRSLNRVSQMFGGRAFRDTPWIENEPSHNQFWTAVNDSIDALFEIAPGLIDEGAIGLVERLFNIPENRKGFLRDFESTWLNSGHPLGAKFIHERLAEMDMAERDLAWSEYIRDWPGREHTDEAIRALYERCSNLSNIQERECSRLHLLAARAMWTLTTTIRPLRDQATRALYWYGRRFPGQFFGLLKRSFRINDPYVRERMLAAAYGVAMARQYDFDSDEFVEEQLPTWAQHLFKTMFASDAPCSTTHVLMRDYARHIIDVAEMHHPGLFTTDELEAARPPYDGGDIESWGSDTGRPATDDSVGPILMDFGNYTLGSLVPDRSNYDDEHPVFKELKGKAYWRIYDLGWTTDRFGKIDREIQRNQSLSRNNQSGKTDRYGKKYSWVAYFELYGHRLDHNAVDQWDLRLSDVDIDPSFPEPPPSQKLLDQHWLGSAEVSTRSWIKQGDIPNLESFALRDEILGEEGPWVLLNAFYDHDDTDLERDLWFRVCGALIDTTEAQHAVQSERLRENVHSGGIIPSNHYTFAGEVPWADTFPNNQELQIHETLDSQSYPKEVLGIVDGDQLSEEEKSQIFAKLQRLWEDHSGTVDSVDELNDLFDDDGVEFELTTAEGHEIECVQVMDVLPAVWRNDWEGYHNEINTGPRGEVPARQICDLLRLVSRPQTYDLFEPSGDRATITTSFEEEQGPVRCKQQFLYIRKDLIDKYLKQTSQTLLIWMGGERQYSVKVFTGKQRTEDVAPPYRKNFHDVHPYDPSV